MSLARTKLQNALTSFFNSEIFIALYSAFVAIVSFLDCNALILSVVLLVLSFIFFTQKDFMIMDVGHYESEIEIVAILFSLLKKNFPTFAVRITENIYSNPVFYF